MKNTIKLMVNQVAETLGLVASPTSKGTVLIFHPMNEDEVLEVSVDKFENIEIYWNGLGVQVCKISDYDHQSIIEKTVKLTECLVKNKENWLRPA